MALSIGMREMVKTVIRSREEPEGKILMLEYGRRRVLKAAGGHKAKFCLCYIFYRGGSRGRVQGVRTSPPRDDLRFSKTTGILQKKKKRSFIGVEVEQETSAPPLKKNPGSAPVLKRLYFGCFRGDLDKILKRS